MFFHVLFCKVIHRENTVLSTCFDRHICNCKTIIHRQILNSITHKFHRFVKCTIHTDHSDNM